ncbi:hypothetical protein [Streptomyces sp. NRRL S-340]|uniref:hypothetical protein n=1 Tax=Streptomyces sp. NRRL S-340 TaxID=1463901 RepID=UPI0005697252|nr:hypothetical protein [Streptomyces sp. NRRL S-340]
MAWDEWEQLKAAAAVQHSTRMQLNQLPGDQNGTSSTGSGASGRLRSDRKAWSTAGQGVGDLRDDIGKALTKLRRGTTGIDKDKDSACSTAAAQKRVYDSWERRVKDISELCNGLASVLEKVGNDQLKTDESIKAEIAGLKVHSEDMSAAGGREKGR